MGHRGILAGCFVVLAVLASSCADDDSTSSGSSTTESGSSSAATSSTAAQSTTMAQPEETLVLMLPEYPFWENSLLEPDEEYLDELAAAYLETGADPDAERFLYGNAPVIIFDEILSGELSEADLSSRLWVLHLSGWFGGRWLRRELAAAQPDAPIQAVDRQLTEEGFTETITLASAAIEKAFGDPESARTFVEESLWPAAETEGDETNRGLVDGFAYNVGYLDEILDTPPEGIVAPVELSIDCVGALACEYTTPRLEALPQLVTAAEPYLEESSEQILEVQEPAVERGRGVWSGGLSVQGFDQVAYDQLIDVSNSFLETVQGSALAALIGASGDSPESATAASTAIGAQTIWLEGYFAGLFDGTEPFEVPTFE